MNKPLWVQFLFNLRIAFFPIMFGFASGLALAHDDQVWCLIYGAGSLFVLLIESLIESKKDYA